MRPAHQPGVSWRVGSPTVQHRAAAGCHVGQPHRQLSEARVKGGFRVDEPALTDVDAGDLRFTTDFRSVDATLLQDVLGVEAKASLGWPFTPFPLL